MNRKPLWIVSMLALLAPHSLLACAACAGQPDSAMSQGLTWAILFLVGVIGCVLAGVTVFFVNVGRKSTALMPDDDDSSANRN